MDMQLIFPALIDPEGPDVAYDSTVCVYVCMYVCVCVYVDRHSEVGTFAGNTSTISGPFSKS